MLNNPGIRDSSSGNNSQVADASLPKTHSERISYIGREIAKNISNYELPFSAIRRKYYDASGNFVARWDVNEELSSFQYMVKFTPVNSERDTYRLLVIVRLHDDSIGKKSAARETDETKSLEAWEQEIKNYPRPMSVLKQNENLSEQAVKAYNELSPTSALPLLSTGPMNFCRTVLSIPEGNLQISPYPSIAMDHKSALSERDAMLSALGVEKLDTTRIALFLPNCQEQMVFLKRAQELSKVLHQTDPEKYPSTRAIFPDCLIDWHVDSKQLSSDTEKIGERVLSKIDGCVQESTGLSREEQNRRGWNNISACELALAHSAFYLLTGKDLFDGHHVRTLDGVLFFTKYGLSFSPLRFTSDKNTDVASHSY